jgi:hypothetical protein
MNTNRHLVTLGTLLLALFGLAAPARGAIGATVRFAITNSDGTDYNGPLWVYTVGAGDGTRPILADGSFFIGSRPQRLQVTNSLGSATCMRGTYFASNSVIAYCFAVPLDTGSFNAASNKVSGYNLFEYVPGCTPDQATNIAWAVALNALSLYPGGGGTGPWTASGNTIYPSGASVAGGGWVASGSTIYPQ